MEFKLNQSKNRKNFIISSLAFVVICANFFLKENRYHKENLTTTIILSIFLLFVFISGFRKLIKDNKEAKVKLDKDKIYLSDLNLSIRLIDIENIELKYSVTNAFLVINTKQNLSQPLQIPFLNKLKTYWFKWRFNSPTAVTIEDFELPPKEVYEKINSKFNMLIS